MISIQNIELNENPFKYDQHIKIKSQKLFLIEKIGDVLKSLTSFTLLFVYAHYPLEARNSMWKDKIKVWERLKFRLVTKW